MKDDKSSDIENVVRSLRRRMPEFAFSISPSHEYFMATKKEKEGFANAIVRFEKENNTFRVLRGDEKTKKLVREKLKEVL